jgi:hypothetical protein
LTQPSNGKECLSRQDAGSTQVNPDLVIRAGQEAWSRLRKGLADWIAVAEALQHGQHLAMLESRSNAPKGSRFQAIMGEWLRATGFNEIDKGVRSRLLDLFKHRAEIEAWLLADRLARLTPTKAKQVIELLPELYAERAADFLYEKSRPRARKKRRTIEDFQRDLAARKAAGAEGHQKGGATCSPGPQIAKAAP